MTSQIAEIRRRAGRDVYCVRRRRAVIHTAGVSPSMGAAEFVMRVNAIGTVNVNEQFYAIAREGFAIVNVASMAAHTLPRIAIPTRQFRYALQDEAIFMKKMMSACRIAPERLRPRSGVLPSARASCGGTAIRRRRSSGAEVPASCPSRRDPSTPRWAGWKSRRVGRDDPLRRAQDGSADPRKSRSCWRSAPVIGPVT